SRDGASVFMLSSAGVNAARLLRVDLASGARTVLAEDPIYDVSSVVRHPETLETQGVTFHKEREEWVYLDEAFGAEVERLRQDLDGELAIGRPLRDDRTWLIREV